MIPDSSRRKHETIASRQSRRDWHASRMSRLVLSGTEAVVADRLSKCYFELADRLYRAPTPILTRARRGRRLDGGFEEDDDDDDDEDVDQGSPPSEEVWALQDVSFSIARGEAVGLIGDVGSGKTTLLRVLGGVAPATSGRAALRGKPSPLAHVALQFMEPGFSPTYNAGLAASLAGVSRNKLRPRLRSILEFAGVPEGEWTYPATRSPFHVAVATALNLDASVLLLDDPFSVADGGFRERCEQLIEQRRAEGAAILLESRDTAVLRRLCGRSLWLGGGRIVAEGPTEEILSAFAERESGSPADEESPRGFNDVSAIAAVAAESPGPGLLVVDVLLEQARGPLFVQVGVGLEREDGYALLLEQSEPVKCKREGFHRFRLEAADVPDGAYVGRVTVRLRKGDKRWVIGRRGAFFLAVGRTGELARLDEARSEVAVWEEHQGEWTYASGNPFEPGRR